MDLKQIELDLSLKLEASQAAGYLDFVQCVTEIKYRNSFEMMSGRPYMLDRLVPFFQQVLSSSEIMAAGVATSFLETVLCQKKEVLFCWISLMRLDWTSFWRFDVLIWLIYFPANHYNHFNCSIFVPLNIGFKLSNDLKFCLKAI
ncbi:hypothetical protein BpHYR1_017756 [Brachionus plicatilis]|uniref:Uncharacterized protein n=1 Tax=Brachionus plicatilis TaxID=10195 RepID=A0A3M7S6X5_BRAPC|nr:hypothetical protein BpHYR1_017756 [Brachionus plicatilis]